MVIKLVVGTLIMREKICNHFYLMHNFRGGGSYNENGVKIGKWIELIEGFKNY